MPNVHIDTKEKAIEFLESIIVSASEAIKNINNPEELSDYLSGMEGGIEQISGWNYGRSTITATA